MESCAAAAAVFAVPALRLYAWMKSVGDSTSGLSSVTLGKTSPSWLRGLTAMAGGGLRPLGRERCGRRGMDVEGRPGGLPSGRSGFMSGNLGKDIAVQVSIEMDVWGASLCATSLAWEGIVLVPGAEGASARQEQGVHLGIALCI